MIEQLQAIGFHLSVSEIKDINIRVPVEESIKSIAEFKNVHGHVNVTNLEDSNPARLCNRTSERLVCRNPLPGVTMKVTQTQDPISVLNALGFKLKH